MRSFRPPPWRAIRDAFRALRRTPLFALLAVSSLGFALGVNVTVFSLADAAVHPVTPVPEPERVAMVAFRGGDPTRELPYAEKYAAVAATLGPVANVASVTLHAAALQAGDRAESQFVAGVSPDFFRVLGVRAYQGRLVDAGTTDGAVVSFRLWRRLFASRPVAQGLVLAVGRQSVPVIGVLPPHVHAPLGTDVWMPESLVAGDSGGRVFGPMPFVRLARGVTRAEADAALRVAARRLDATLGSRERPLLATLKDLRTESREVSALEGLLVVVGAVILLVSCANLGTLMLARTTVRRREIALRMALGARRGRVVVDVLAETGLIVAAGAAVGVVVASWSLGLLSTYGPRFVTELGDVTPVLSARAVVYATVAAALTLALAGVLPALRAASVAPATPLKDGAGGATGRLGRAHHALIVFQVACAMTLLVAAALTLDSNARLRAFRFDYAARDLLVAQMDFRARDFPDSAATTRTYRALTGGAAALPGASGAATIAGVRPPGLVVVAENGRAGTRYTYLDEYSLVTAGYLRTVGIPVVAGRDFEEGDESGSGAVIVDEAAARRLWPDVASPVGRRIKLGRETSAEPWLEVVGVARRVDRFPRRDDDALAPPALYVVSDRASPRGRRLIVRSASPATTAALALLLRRQIEATVPRSVAPVRSYLSDWDDRLARLAFLAWLFTVFAAFAMLLAALGLYGVLAYSVSQRSREYAVRMALGADARRVARSVLRETAVLVLAGIGLGAFAALAAAGILGEQLFVGSYSDVLALVTAETVFLLAAACAVIGPLRQATRAEPASILRAV